MEALAQNERLHFRPPTTGAAHCSKEAADDREDVPELDRSQLHIIIDMAGQDVARRCNLPEAYFEAPLESFKQSIADTAVHADLPTYSKTDVLNAIAAVAELCMESLKHSSADSSE